MQWRQDSVGGHTFSVLYSTKLNKRVTPAISPVTDFEASVLYKYVGPQENFSEFWCYHDATHQVLKPVMFMMCLSDKSDQRVAAWDSWESVADWLASGRRDIDLLSCPKDGPEFKIKGPWEWFQQPKLPLLRSSSELETLLDDAATSAHS